MQIQLRRTTQDDLAFVLAAQSADDNRPFITLWPEARHRAALADADAEHFIVEARSEDRPVGFVLIRGLQNEARSVELKRVVVTVKGKGYGRAAVRAVMQRAFGTLAAHRLWLDVKAHNLRARAVYEKEGFRYEGTLRECLRGPKGFESLVVMSVLEQEYRHA